MDSGKGCFHRVYSRRLGLDDVVLRLGANRFLDCLDVNLFVYLFIFVYWSYIVR